MRAACIAAYIGASGSGKTTALQRDFLHPRPDRLAVWDFKREYHHLTAIGSAAELLRVMARPRFAFRVIPPMDVKQRRAWFALFCEAAYRAGDCTVIVEEAAFVTSPQRAPDAWRLLTLTGRDYVLPSGRRCSLRLAFTTQRPASIDKDALGNCSQIWCGRLLAPRDVHTMATVLGVPEAQLLGLRDLQHIRRDVLGGSASAADTLRLPPKAQNLQARRPAGNVAPRSNQPDRKPA
jgi:hypothetical protein